METLLHRGPDQQGVFQSNLFSVGAARLKIIDLVSGGQINDFQTGCADGKQIGLEYTLLIRPAMKESFHRLPNSLAGRGRVFMRISCDSAQIVSPQGVLAVPERRSAVTAMSFRKLLFQQYILAAIRLWKMQKPTAHETGRNACPPGWADTILKDPQVIVSVGLPQAQRAIRHGGLKRATRGISGKWKIHPREPAT